MYRMIACSVSDYEPTMGIEKIEALDEFDRDYFIVEEGSLAELRKIAVETGNEWWDSKMEDAPATDAEVAQMKVDRDETAATLASLEVGATLTDVCSMNDWIRIETVADADEFLGEVVK